MAGKTDEEDIYTIRVISLLTDIGRHCLLQAFLHEVPKEKSVHQYLQENDKRKILDQLLMKKIITVKQFDQLFAEKINPEEFDFTLLYALLRYIVVQAPVTGWTSMPKDDDISIGAALIRIRDLRNQVFHLPSKLNRDDFEDIWDELSENLKRIVRLTQGESECEEVRKNIKELKKGKLAPKDVLDRNAHSLMQWSVADFSNISEVVQHGLVCIFYIASYIPKKIE